MVRINQQTITFPADTVTPISVYLKLRDEYPGAALLEGADQVAGSENYSYIGILPIAEFRVEGEQITYSYPDSETTNIDISDRAQVLSEMRTFLSGFQLEGERPDDIINGLIGYSSYNCVRYFEELDITLNKPKAEQIPDMLYRLYRFVIAFNHYRDTITILENTPENVFIKIKPENLKYSILHRDLKFSNFHKQGKEVSTITDEQHGEIIVQAKKHIQRGDVFQIVPSRMFSQKFDGDDFMVYRALRSINPSPYLFYLDFEDFKIFGSSPEAHLVVTKGQAKLFPIAGTYKRTGDKEYDDRKVHELLEDEKEVAEHTMLVDLARNDLSRHCNNVTLSEYKKVKEYSHVIHITSEVIGRLRKGADSLDLYEATFPMGTLSGAPKYRAMEIIDELEVCDRGPYAGAIGLIGFDSEINKAIVIRSFLSKNDTLYFQAGGGLVSESVVEVEIDEVSNKLGALRAAMDLAEGYND